MARVIQNLPLKSASKIAEAQGLNGRGGRVHLFSQRKRDGRSLLIKTKLKRSRRKDPRIRSQLPRADENGRSSQSPYIILYFTRPLTVSRLYTLQLIYRATFIPRISRRMRLSSVYTAAKTSRCRERLVARERERERASSSYNSVTTSSHPPPEPPAGNRALLKRHGAAGTMNDTEKAERNILSSQRALHSPGWKRRDDDERRTASKTKRRGTGEREREREGGEGGRKIVT